MSFGCAFGDQKDDHHFIRVKASKMTVFTPHVMPGMPPNQASMLSTLMAAAKAKAAVFLRFINDDNNELEIDDDDDDDGEDDDLMLDDWFGLAPPLVLAMLRRSVSSDCLFDYFNPVAVGGTRVDLEYTILEYTLYQ
jgi:hypothetical protein